MAESGIVLDIIQNAKDIYHNAYTVIEVEHAEIHLGNTYDFCKSTTALGASSYIDLQFNCNSTSKAVHMKLLQVNNSGGLAQVQLFKMVTSTASTWSNSTTVITAHQKNGNSTNVNTLTIGYQPTLITSTCYTETLRDYYIGSTGTVQSRSNVEDSHYNENVLAYGTTYVFRVTNLGTAGYCSIRGFFYEE